MSQIIWMAQKVGETTITLNKKFGSSDELRAVLKQVDGLNVLTHGEDDRRCNSVIYKKSRTAVDDKDTVWVGIFVNEDLPDESLEEGIQNALKTHFGLSDIVFASEIGSEDGNYQDVAEELNNGIDTTQCTKP